LEAEKTRYVISLDSIREIISLDAEPVLRNLKITQCYYDISQAIAQRLGHENANWCNFATWASKTAGRFIRLENVNVHLHRSLHLSDDYHKWLLVIQEKFNDLALEQEFGHDQVHAASLNTISVISADIAAGNLKVFAELGPVFSFMIDAFDKSLGGDYSAVDFLLNSLQPGATEEGGQDLLGQAIGDFHAALHEPDQSKKAEFILRANAQTGLHEQIRLQPYIAGALEAPLPHLFSAAIHRQVAETAPAHKHYILKGMLHQLIAPVCHKVHDAWLAMSTHYLMTLALPGEVLHLGHDLPSPAGGPLFPDQLLNPQDEKLNRLLVEYEAHLNTTLHSRSRNWAKLEDRMHYILKLFRSRQQHRPLHEPPFEETQIKDILQNKVPGGKL
jgi:hypothetical protein